MMARKWRIVPPVFLWSVWIGFVTAAFAASIHARTLDLSVVASDTQQTLAGASVTAVWTPNGATSARLVGGRFRLELPEGLSEVRVVAKHAGRVPQQIVVIGTNFPPRLSLPPARTFSGSVLDESGKAVSDVRVFLNFPRRLTGPRIPVDDLPVVTDAQGRWIADWIPAEITQLRVQLRHPDFETTELSDPPLVAFADGSARSRLKPVLRLEGVVLDPSGQPLAETDVFYGDEYMLWGIEENRKTKTDAAGKFSFPGLAAKKWAVGVFSPRFAPLARVVELKPGLQPLAFKLVPAAWFRHGWSMPKASRCPA